MGTRLLNELNGHDMRNSLNEQACAVGLNILNIHEGGHAGSRNRKRDWVQYYWVTDPSRSPSPGPPPSEVDMLGD